MRRILIGSGIVLAILLLSAVIILSRFDVNKFRPRVEARLEKSLHRKVSLGPMSLKYLPLEVKLDSLTIDEDPSFNSPLPFASASDVSLRIGLLSLLTGEPEVESVILHRPQVELIRNAAGKWNFSSMISKKDGGGASDVKLDDLKMEDGQVAYTDRMGNTPRAIYDHIGLHATGYAPNKQFGLDLDAHLPGQGQQLISLRSQVGPFQENGAPAAVPVEGKITLKEITLSGLSRFAAGTIPPNTDTTLSGDVSVRNANQAVSAQGQLSLNNTTVKGSKVDYPIAATFDVSNDLKADLLRISSADIRLGPTPFRIAGTVNNSGSLSVLDLKVAATDASVTELATLAGSFGFAFNPAYKVKGRLSADILAKGPASAPQLSGKVNGSNIEVAGGEIKQPVRIPAVSVSLSPETIVAQPFTAESGSTRLEVAFTAGNYTSKAMTLDASARTDNANVAELMNMAKAYGVAGSDGMSGSGKLSLNVRVQGVPSDFSSLNYSGTGALSNATLSAPAALTRPVSISSVNLSFSRNSVAADNLVASLGSSSFRGNLSAKNFSAPEVAFQLAADKINVGELQGLTATPQKSAPQSGKASPSPLLKMTGGGSLSAKTILSDDFMLSNVSTTVKLNNGVVTLSPLSADLYGGKETGTIVLDVRPANPVCSVQARLTGVNTNSLLSAVSSVKDTLYGSLGAATDVRFILGGGNNIARTLNGTLNFNVENGELKRVNIMHEISTVARFLSPGNAAAASGSSTRLTKLAGALNLRDGEASTNNLMAAINGASLSAKGTVNLISQAIQMDVNAVLQSGLTKAVGGTNVGGFLQTALANNKGELVVPVKVTGTLQHPSFTPDAQSLAQMKLNNLLPTTGDPTKGIVGALLGGKSGSGGGVVGGILNGLNGQKSGTSEGQNAQKPEDLIKGILGQFGKKKKQE